MQWNVKTKCYILRGAVRFRGFGKADCLIAECDLLLILGSSLVVYPVAFYPHKALSVGAKLAIINIQETEMDGSSEVVIHEKIGETLPKIIEIVERELNN